VLSEAGEIFAQLPKEVRNYVKQIRWKDIKNTLQTQLEAKGRSPEEIATLVSRVDADAKLA